LQSEPMTLIKHGFGVGIKLLALGVSQATKFSTLVPFVRQL